MAGFEDSSKTHNNESMSYADTFIKLIEKYFDDLPGGQRKLAQQYLEHPELLTCFSLADLSQRTGASQATIIRFCRSIGYKGFLEFSKDIQQALQAQLTVTDRFKLSVKHEKVIDPLKSKNIERLFELGMEGLSHLKENIKESDFAECINAMTKADKIYIVGRLSSFPLAMHFSLMLSKITDNVVLIDRGIMQSLSTLNGITENSLVFSIAFPRYPQSTVNLVKRAYEQGATIVSLTNSRLCPTVPFSTYTLVTPVEPLSYIDVYISPLALISAIVVAFGEMQPEKSQQYLNTFDAFAIENSLFVK